MGYFFDTGDEGSGYVDEDDPGGYRSSLLPPPRRGLGGPVEGRAIAERVAAKLNRSKAPPLPMVNPGAVQVRRVEPGGHVVVHMGGERHELRPGQTIEVGGSRITAAGSPCEAAGMKEYGAAARVAEYAAKVKPAPGTLGKAATPGRFQHVVRRGDVPVRLPWHWPDPGVNAADRCPRAPVESFVKADAAQLVRDYASHVPEGLDPRGWAGVVRLLAADAVEPGAAEDGRGGPAARMWSAHGAATVMLPAFVRDRYVHRYEQRAALDRLAEKFPAVLLVLLVLLAGCGAVDRGRCALRGGSWECGPVGPRPGDEEACYCVEGRP